MAEKNNKVDSKFSYVGAFWLPDSADKDPDTGTLSSDARHINLTTAPVYKELKSSDFKQFFNSMQSQTVETIETVHGRISDGDCAASLRRTTLGSPTCASISLLPPASFEFPFVSWACTSAALMIHVSIQRDTHSRTGIAGCRNTLPRYGNRTRS